MRRLPILLAILALTGCLSWRIDRAHDLHEAKMREYAGKCVDAAHTADLATGEKVIGGLPVGAVAPSWCDEAQAALDELRTANAAAEEARGTHGTAGVKARLSAARDRVRRAFDEH